MSTATLRHNKYKSILKEQLHRQTIELLAAKPQLTI